MLTYKERIENFKRDLLQEFLSQCSEAQQELFRKIYVGKVPVSKLDDAIDLCERTVLKNRAGRKA